MAMVIVRSYGVSVLCLYTIVGYVRRRFEERKAVSEQGLQ